MASANATKEAIWLRMLLTDLGFALSAATVLHADNQGCIALVKNPIAHSCTKHFDICHHFVREWVSGGEVSFRYCPTTQMVADILTKALPRDLFEKFRST